MAEYLALLRIVLYTAGSVALLFAFVFYLLYRRAQRMRQPPPRDPQFDLANMRILFQTMRDVIEQQKDLARQLNEHIDKKIAYIKRIASKTLEDFEKLRGVTRDLVLELDEARTELTSVQKQVGYISQDLKKTPIDLAERKTEETILPRKQEEPPEPEPEKPTLQILANPKDESPVGDLVDQWVGLDLGGGELEPERFEAPEAPPGKPENAQAARQAFKALLDISSTQPQETAGALDTGSALGRVDSGDGRSRGASGITPLQARIYEYKDAGMTVPQIARELGVGKGEVRLVLSLRKDRER